MELPARQPVGWCRAGDRVVLVVGDAVLVGPLRRPGDVSRKPEIRQVGRFAADRTVAGRRVRGTGVVEGRRARLAIQQLPDSHRLSGRPEIAEAGCHRVTERHHGNLRSCPAADPDMNPLARQEPALSVPGQLELVGAALAGLPGESDPPGSGRNPALARQPDQPPVEGLAADRVADGAGSGCWRFQEQARERFATAGRGPPDALLGDRAAGVTPGGPAHRGLGVADRCLRVCPRPLARQCPAQFGRYSDAGDEGKGATAVGQAKRSGMHQSFPASPPAVAGQADRNLPPHLAARDVQRQIHRHEQLPLGAAACHLHSGKGVRRFRLCRRRRDKADRDDRSNDPQPDRSRFLRFRPLHCLNPNPRVNLQMRSRV